MIRILFFVLIFLTLSACGPTVYEIKYGASVEASGPSTEVVEDTQGGNETTEIIIYDDPAYQIVPGVYYVYYPGYQYVYYYNGYIYWYDDTTGFWYYYVPSRGVWVRIGSPPPVVIRANYRVIRKSYVIPRVRAKRVYRRYRLHTRPMVRAKRTYVSPRRHHYGRITKGRSHKVYRRGRITKGRYTTHKSRGRITKGQTTYRRSSTKTKRRGRIHK